MRETGFYFFSSLKNKNGNNWAHLTDHISPKRPHNNSQI